jgi:hypothetical protein
MQSKIWETGVSKVWLRDDGFIHLEYLPNTHLGLEDSKRIIADIEKASAGQSRPGFIDATGLKSVTREAREYFAASKVISRAGMLTGSLISRVLGNFYLAVNKPVIPLKMFTSEAEAIAWLKKHG